MLTDHTIINRRCKHLSTAGRPTRPKRSLRVLVAFVIALMGVGMLTPRTGGVMAASHTVMQAQTISPLAALERLMTAPHVQASWFAPILLAQVSVTQIEQVMTQLQTQLGAYKTVQPQSDGSYLVVYQHGTATASIHLDSQGRIDGLLFTQVHVNKTSASTVLQQFRQLPGQVSVAVITGGITTTALNANQPLAVGSTFKLAILAALQREIRAGKHNWSEVVTLTQADKSLPSGILQTWPVGSHLTVETLASLMISQSDNTAADTLIYVVGRPAINALVPARDRPILTTHAAFVLKDPAHAALQATYLHGDVAQRLNAVQQAEMLPLPSVSLFTAGHPVSPQIEWFFTPRQLCDLMQQVDMLPLMSINPGVANPADWQHIAYKGGSEPGVLNLTTMVTTHSGTTACVAATWNNTSALPQTRFETMYASLLASVQ